jgi:hypothetical protein
MKTPTIEDLLKLGKVLGEVCLVVVAYGTVNLNPVLVHRAVGLAIVGSLFSCVWVLWSTKEKFHRSPTVVRKPFLSLAVAAVCYFILQLSIDFLDYHTPPEGLGILADLFILLLFALTFSLLALSVCSLLREIGIHPLEYLEKLKGR